MKKLLAIFPFALLTACVTTYPASQFDCSSLPEITTKAKAPLNIGSAEATMAYENVALANKRGDTALAKNLATTALNTLDITPEGRAAFMSRRIGQFISDGDLKSAKEDFDFIDRNDAFEAGEKATLDMQIKRVSSAPYGALDEQAKPLVRIPPILPQILINENKSGNCVLVFDINTEGNTENVKATYCTDLALEDASISSLSRWKYIPALKNGAQVIQVGVKTKIRYSLQDECGRLLPE